MRFWLWSLLHCRRCGRWCRGRYCRDFDDCIAREQVLWVETYGDLLIPREHPPLDREGFDWLRPADLDVCHTCKGQGQMVVRQDWETGIWEVEDCRWCGGTGEEPVLHGYLNWHPDPATKAYWSRLVS